MPAIQTIRVVLGEGQPGLLRLILEAQGIEVIGHARDDDELLRVLDVTSPSVIVLDAGISALAASAARARSDGAPIVVVWPRDAVTPLATERIEPSGVILELGNAVRRAARPGPAGEPIRIPDDSRVPETTDLPLQPRTAGRARRATRHVLVAVSAWVLSLSALGAIGVALPKVFDALDQGGGRAVTVDRADRGRVGDREGVGTRRTTPRSDDDAPRCVPDRDAEPGPGRGKGCGNGDGSGRGRGADQGRGRPDDAGSPGGRDENARGSGGKDEPPEDGAGPGAGSSDGSSGGGKGDQEQGAGEQGDGRRRGSSDADDGGGGGPADPPAGTHAGGGGNH